MLRTIVVDDSIIFRKVVRDSLASIRGVEVIDIAKDGLSAVEKIKRLRPDLVTLDVEMPGLDGLQVLEELQSANIHPHIIMISSHTERGASVTMQALQKGAFDFVLKPCGGDACSNTRQLGQDLEQRIALLRKQDSSPPSRTQPALPRVQPRRSPENRSGPLWQHQQASEIDSPAKGQPPFQASPFRAPAFRAGTNGRQPTAPIAITPSTRTLAQVNAIVIGVSTGGPKALRSLVPSIPAKLAVPVFIVQHMPPVFTKTMADDLNRISKVQVFEAENQMPAKPGCVYIAPGGKQMGINSTSTPITIDVNDDSAINSCKPSVDYLFDSAANCYRDKLLAIVMTGMGNDGTVGSRQIVAKGGCVWAQDEASCTVFGMPRRVIEAHLVDQILSLKEIELGIQSLVSRTASVYA